MRLEKIQSPCGCSMNDDGIDTDLLHLLPSYIYELVKRRAKIKSKNSYGNNHKEWIKKQALKKGMSLRDYLYSLSPEIGTHIEVIETFQQGGEVPEDLLEISNSINDRINEIYKSQEIAQEGNRVQYAQNGVSKVDLSVDKKSKVNLLNDSVKTNKFSDGYKTVSNTGFLEINPQFAQDLEADSCYKLDKNNIPIKVSCQNPEARKGSSFVRTKDGNRYYMREEIAEKTTYDYIPGKEGSKGSSTGPRTETVGDIPHDRTKQGNSTHTKDNCNSGCKAILDISIKDLRSKISPKYYPGTRKFLNGVVNLALKAEGATEDTIIRITHNGNNFEHAASKGCFCQYTGEIPGTTTPPTPGKNPNTIEKKEQERNVTVAEDGPNPFTEDKLVIPMAALIRISMPMSDWEYKKARPGTFGSPIEEDKKLFTKSASNSYSTKIAFDAIGTLDGKFVRAVLTEATQGTLSKKVAINLGIIPDLKVRGLTPEEIEKVYNPKFNQKILDEIINNIIKESEAEILETQKTRIENKFKDSIDTKVKEGLKESTDGSTTQVQSKQGGGIYNNIGKERLFHQFNSGKERDLQELLQWKSMQVDPRYLNKK